MAKQKRVVEETGEDDKIPSPIEQLRALLDNKEFAGKHYGLRNGNELVTDDKISTGSLTFDIFLDGGFRPGWSLFEAEPELGKTAQGLVFAREWQKYYKDKSFVIYVNGEGRIKKENIDRSGIDTSPERFIIWDCNNADIIFDKIKDLLIDNPLNTKYFVIIDSTDSLLRDMDWGKNIGDREGIGGTATILSRAGKVLSLSINLQSSHIYFISQIRDVMQSMPGQVGGAGKKSSGGHARKFYSSLTAKMSKVFPNPNIYEDPATKTKILGHLIELKFLKTPNEKTGQSIVIPIKRGKVGGVWVEWEAYLLALQWGWIQSKASWFNFTNNNSFNDKLKEKTGIDLKNPAKPGEFKKVQGEKGLVQFLEENPPLVEHIRDMIKAML